MPGNLHPFHSPSLIQEFSTPPAVPNPVVVSPDGKWLAVNRLLFDMESKSVVGPLGIAIVHAAVFIDNKTLRFLTSDMSVTTWDVEKTRASQNSLIGRGIGPYSNWCNFPRWKVGCFW